MKKHLVIGIIGCSFLLSGCLVVGPRGKRRQGVHSHKCHASEYWDGHKCKHKKHRNKDKKGKHKKRKHKHKN